MRLLNRWNGYEEKLFFFQNFFFRQKEKKGKKNLKKKNVNENDCVMPKTRTRHNSVKLFCQFTPILAKNSI